LNLVIVESPAKGHTIEKYLGKDFKVAASFGHVRNLPKKELGVEVDKDFEAKYIIMPKSRKTITYLKSQLEKADKLYIATDFDREGEAIGWHIVQALRLGQSKKRYSKNQKNAIAKIFRITFHEITKTAILEAVKNPRDIDMNLVNAQQARRILDRLVGYKLSPFLWAKVAKGLSAGRVQSVALRLIVQREREIDKFVPTEYWSVEATLSKKGQKDQNFKAILIEADGKPFGELEIKTAKQAKQILVELAGAKYQVAAIKQEKKPQYPFPPFTTSTLQQDGYYKLKFSAKKTMKLAQDLYEAGYITYMRTDSTNLSWLAINSMRKYISANFGEKYLPAKPRVYKSKKAFIQEAHEAIRPTYVSNEKLKIKNEKITEDHQKLYDLIWARSVACQMKEAIFDQIEVKISAAKYIFKATGKTLDFDGFLKVYPLKIAQITIPSLNISEILALLKLDQIQHFTKPPYRYTQATLVKVLEEKGIGRPSTYVPIISIIIERGYVIMQRGYSERSEKKGTYFYPTDIGKIVNDMLVAHFPAIVDFGFTANLEQDLDEVAHGNKKYVEVLKAFYLPFEQQIKQKTKEVPKKDMSKFEIKEKCPKCGGKLVMRLSKFGQFLGCQNYPKCKHTQSLKNKK